MLYTSPFIGNAAALYFIYAQQIPAFKANGKKNSHPKMVVFLFIFFAGFIIAAINYYYPVGKRGTILGELP